MSIEKQYVSFNDDFTDWQYASGVIIPKQRGLMIKDITVYCAYDYNGKDYTFTWTKGRQLASATVDGKTVEYTYDMSGVRTSKTVNGTTYNYTTLPGKVMRQQWGNKSLEFVYDDKAATDASLGWGSNLIIAGATTAATAPRAPQKSKHKKNNVSEYRYAKEDHIRWKYYAEHFANIG